MFWATRVHVLVPLMTGIPRYAGTYTSGPDCGRAVPAPTSPMRVFSYKPGFMNAAREKQVQLRRYSYAVEVFPVISGRNHCRGLRTYLWKYLP